MLLKMTTPLALGVLGAAVAFGQGTQATPHSSDSQIPVFHASTEFVLLDALVENKKTGALAGNLEAKDFLLTEDGAPQNITYISHDRLPLSVVFLFDLTDTVRPVLKPLAAAAHEILGHLKPQDEVSVMGFSSHTELLQNFTTDRDLAATAIEKASDMKSRDGTFIHEDMYEAVGQAMQSTAPESRRVLVWLTDGTTNFENSLTQKAVGKEAPPRLHTREEATDRLLHSNVVASALIERSAMTDAIVAMTDSNPLFFIAGARIGDINKYADLTGGPVLKTSKQEIAARLAELIDRLRGQYTLGYKPSTAKPDGTFCKLQLTLAPSAYKDHPELRKSEIRVRAKLGYYR